MKGRVEILGVPVDVITSNELLDRVASWASGDACRLVFTPNPEMVVEAQRNAAFMSTLKSCDLNLPDGIGLSFAALLQGKKLRRIPGADAAEQLVSLAALRGWRVFLLGGGRGVAALAAQNLARKNPGLDIGIWDLGFDVDHSGFSGQTSDVISRISACRPHILLVAFGAPKQELWLTQNRESLEQAGVRVAMGVGGALDYWAGAVRRAPKFVRALGLEWLVRLLVQPRRLPRIVRATAAFSWLTLAEKLNRR